MFVKTRDVFDVLHNEPAPPVRGKRGNFVTPKQFLCTPDICRNLRHLETKFQHVFSGTLFIGIRGSTARCQLIPEVDIIHAAKNQK